jgi:uncharacterized membrane protein (DUF2068 family)
MDDQPAASRPRGVTVICALLAVKGLASLAMATDLILLERVDVHHVYQYLAVPGLLTGALLLYKAYGLWHLHYRALVMVLVAVTLDCLASLAELLAGTRVPSVWVNLALSVAIAAYLLQRGVRRRFHAGRVASHTR